MRKNSLGSSLCPCSGILSVLQIRLGLSCGVFAIRIAATFEYGGIPFSAGDAFMLIDIPLDA